MLFLLNQIPREFIPQYALGIFLAVLVGMTVHEFAHNYVGYLMGDPTPREQGRLTLNPAVHIYWPGFIMFVLIGFGQLGAAPINPYRMRNPRWGYLAAVAAGPISNLLLAAFVAIVMQITGIARPGFGDGLQISLFIILFMMVYFNLILFIFNLLPLFPLDGWWIVYSLLPADLAESWERNRQYTVYAFFGLLLLTFVPLPGIPSPLGLLIGQPLALFLRLLGL